MTLGLLLVDFSDPGGRCPRSNSVQGKCVLLDRYEQSTWNMDYRVRQKENSKKKLFIFSNFSVPVNEVMKVDVDGLPRTSPSDSTRPIPWTLVLRRR